MDTKQNLQEICTSILVTAQKINNIDNSRPKLPTAQKYEGPDAINFRLVKY